MGTTKDKAEFWTLIKTCKGKRYEDDSERWDALLKLLGLPLLAQPLLGAVIAEGRFAKANNPSAYLAMAARNQAKRANLLKREGDKRGAVAEAEAGPVSSISWGVKVRGSALRLKAKCHDEFIELAEFHQGEEHFEDAGLLNHVPHWLRLPDEDVELLDNLGCRMIIDWGKVADHAVATPTMLRAVAFVLLRRFGLGQTAKRMIETKDPALSPLQIQSAWRWIDRNFETKIKPLFAMKREPERQPIKTEPSSFVGPGAALLLAGDRTRRAVGAIDAKAISYIDPEEDIGSWYEVSPPRAVVAVHRVSTRSSRRQ